MRLFVAIRLPEELKRALGGVQQQLKRVLPANSAAWTQSEILHLTLRFLGPVELKHVAELERELRESLSAFGDSDLSCERLGCFPNPSFPRVVWAGVHNANEWLSLLHRRVEEVVGDFAEKPAEEHFVGHVTLARLKSVPQPVVEGLGRFIESTGERCFGTWRCRELELMQSELSSGGSRYTTLAIIRL